MWFKLRSPLMRINGEAGSDGGGSTPAPAPNKNGEQSSCASSCGVNQANIEAGTASAPGATQVNANHIIQYPRQPKRDDGKWIAVGSLLGSLLGKFAESGTINKAKDAEKKWAEINERLRDKGFDFWNKMPSERSTADDADTDLANQYTWNVDQRNAELARAEKLDDCNDSLHEKVCKFAQCGYTPDYDGIKSRIMADVATQTKKARAEMCKSLNRYSARACCGIETALATTSIATSVGALYKAREDERSRSWQINEGLLFKAVELMEKHRGERTNSAAAFDKTAINVQQKRYDAHNGNYFDMAKLGAEFLSSAGKNYAWLAESHRRTAEKMSGNLSTLGGIIGLVLAGFLDFDSGENDCGGKKDKGILDKLKEAVT